MARIGKGIESSRLHYSPYQPPGTQHSFNNDTTPRYDEKAAKEAWQRPIAPFDRRLRDGAKSGKKAGAG